MGYSDTFVDLAVFGWSGTDGTHFGFVVDHSPNDPIERPIVHFYPNNTCDTTLVAGTLPDFVGYLAASNVSTLTAAADAQMEQERQEFEALIPDLVEALDISLPDDPDQCVKVARAGRLKSGVVPTADGIGVTLPETHVDRAYLAGLRWRDRCDSRDRSPAVPSILDEAERRLESGQYGTALVIARNFRYLHWYDDWHTNRAYIRRTASILGRAYSALGRPDIVRAVKEQTDYAVENVK